MILFYLATSMVVAAVTVPFWDVTLLVGTGFFLASVDPVRIYCNLDEFKTIV